MKLVIALLLSAPASAIVGEVWEKHEVEAAGFVWRGNATAKSSHDLLHKKIKDDDLPDAFTWGNVDGVNYLTMSRNQHIPQYCGSCWAHGSVSALADRVKIARKAKGVDLNPSVQHILNCGGGGSCHGGSVDGPYQWLHKLSKEGKGISLETSNPYLACSSESKDGICKGQDWSCSDINVARTCSTFPSAGGFCAAIADYPQITIDDYGSISGQKAMQKEIYARGPISCGIDASAILEYQSGIAVHKGLLETVDHVISVVGWGKENDQQYWIVRNSWGEYWGEMGYIRVAFGSLKVEQQCAWATVKDYTAPEKKNQVHCFEDGGNCKVKKDKPVPELLEKVVGVVEPALLKAAKKLRGGVVA
uniref:Peptidase C1A papain C-terminal domain-containing protein n=2 Tax=Pelagomonas calceolata TaxID=35677 RepID=A0A7S4A6E7_9STRA|mmetsp:Transcript_1066/g.2850  ORF Transcript_1066/g.2850 Transcript_1066/m.2850 type:complete len:362 (-) Transcript_1066:75-1160(-)